LPDQTELVNLLYRPQPLMAEDDSGEEVFQLFWGIKVPANSKVRLPILNNRYTELTGACLGEVTDGGESVLRVHVETILIDDIDEATSDAQVRTEDLVVTVLRPGRTEHSQVSLRFSPLNRIELQAIGPNDIHVSGICDCLNEDDAKEEEEVGDALNETQLAQQVMKLLDERGDQV
jgi:hypothetical protein